MVRVLTCLVLAVAVGACAPLYGSKPEKLKTPEKKRKPAEPADAATETKYVDECNAVFTGDPKGVKQQVPMANQLVVTGDSAIENADRAKEDSIKLAGIKEAIDKYRNALIKDPYNVGATLKLAVAYDRVLRKGCALAMLKRLASLTNNSKWRDEANRNIDAIDANAQWFKGYRKDAMSAVGR